MHIKNGTLSAIKQSISEHPCGIVVFGTGVIGLTVAPAIIEQLQMTERFECFIDNDKTKWGTSVAVGNRDIPICKPDILCDLKEHITILVAVSRYAAAIEQLKEMPCTENMDVYLVPMLCITNFCCDLPKGGNLIRTTQRRIPKIIHYMWLGKKAMPKELIRCIDSWEKNCPDYEILRWDESNYDVHKNRFMAEAYDHGRYGFVPDYARLDLLYHYGGIYMDTDVELFRNIDDLLYQEAFCSVEKWQVLNFGSCSGAMKKHKVLEPFLERWENRRLIRVDGTIDNISSGLIDTSVAMEMGYQINGQCQHIHGMNIYTYDYFNPYDYMTCELHKTRNTYAIHHFHGGWVDEKEKHKNTSLQMQYQKIKERAEWVG